MARRRSDRVPLGRVTPRGASPGDDHVPASSVDVLLADADARFAARVTDLLRKHGLTVIAVGSAVDALEALEDGCRPRLVLVDVTLPIGETRAFLRALGKLCADAAVVALSNGATPHAGFPVDGSLLKPLDAAELLALAWRYCGPA